MSFDSFPVLDLHGAAEGSHSAALAAELGAALREFGFVGVIGHSVSMELRARAYAATNAFFALPEAQKGAYHQAGRGGERGYTPFRVETAKDQTDPDLKEFWHVGRELPEHELARARLPANVWPMEVPDFRESMLALYAALDSLGKTLLSLVATHLGLAPDWFDAAVDHGNSILRPLHYPPLAADWRGVRSAPHEDINLITLLIGSGEPGLEILRPDGSWLPIETPRDQIVVNVGDMLQRLTNHVLPSTTHRVVNPPAPWNTRSRYSLPFFLHFNPEFEIVTLPSCVSETRPDRYPQSITADAYLQQRLREIGLL
ncbi:MAG: 2-oxoglutarate and iron-dependent oxygenase domain-containing protein [Myxococcales bacterium]